jgi:O-methyltransferase
VLDDDAIRQIVVELRVRAPAAQSIGVLGMTSSTAAVIAALRQAGFGDALRVVVSPEAERRASRAPAATVAGLPVVAPDSEAAGVEVLVVASDREKERLLRQYAAERRVDADPTELPEIIVGGYGHFEFRDRIFDALLADGLPASLANGYEYTLVHLYQALRAAAAARLEGAVAEFGTFRGGTTAFLAKALRYLNYDCRLIAFDSFKGFPPRRHLFDLYASVGGFFRDERAVRNYLEPMGVEIVAGDIVETASYIDGVPLVLTFVDTDNYSPAAAALRYVVPQTVVGGAIVFDHYTGRNEFLYTLGEKLAADDLMPEQGFVNLHGTGVFTRIA